MNKYLLVLIFIFSFLDNIYSQAYITSMGARIGDDFGISLQQRVSKRATVEAIYQGGLISQDYGVNVLLEQHFPLLFKNFNFYVGAGIGSRWNHIEDSENDFNQSFAIPMTFGLELTIGKLNLSADFMPVYQLDKSTTDRFVRGSGFSLRYVLIKNNKKRKKAKKKKAKAKAKEKKRKEKVKRKAEKNKGKEPNFFQKIIDKLKPKNTEGA